MILTRRFLWLVALGVIPFALSAVLPGLAFAGLLWNLVLVGLAVADYLRCVSPQTAVTVERIHDEALAVTAPNAITLLVRNTARAPLAALVRDEPPADFALPDPALRQKTVRLPAFGTDTLVYEVVPPRRGDFAWGDVFVRIVAPLGLVIRQGNVPAGETVSVYPNLKAVEDYDLMLRRAQTSRQGTRRVRLVGGGREFAALRDYTPDDEYRTIDWKATARRGKVIARTFDTERSQDILLVMDLGRLMRQEIAYTQKLDHVVNAGLMLAHVVAEADDRVGLLTFADETRAWLPPRRGRAAANDILHALYAARAEPIESDYRGAFRFLAARWRKRSLMVLFTDISDPESSAMLLAEIGQLARAHIVICVLVSDPLVGERARQMPENAAQVYEKAVAEEVIAARRRALNLLKKRGVLVVDALPQDLSVELVARYLAVKNRSMI